MKHSRNYVMHSLLILTGVLLLSLSVVLPRINSVINRSDDSGPPEGALVATPQYQSITQELPYETEHFRIYYDNYYEAFIIVPIISFYSSEEETPQEQIARQWPQYEQFAKEALAWLKSRGANLNEIPIQWSQHEFWPEGKEIPLE